MSGGKVTIDHKQIQEWAESRGGKPARVKSTSDRGGGGLLRIDFPDRRGSDALEEISWQSFFETFDERQLAFLYQDQTADGHESRFSKFIERDAAEVGQPQKQGSGSRKPTNHEPASGGTAHKKRHAKA